MSIKRIGVLFQNLEGSYSVYTQGGTVHTIIKYPFFRDLYLIMEVHDIERLWVMPNTLFSQEIGPEDFEHLTGYEYYAPHKNTYDGKISTVRLRRLYQDSLVGHNQGINRYVIFPAHFECMSGGGNRGQWELTDATFLYWTVNYIETEYGLPFIWSTGKYGEDFLRFVHKRRTGEPIRPLATGLNYQWDEISKKSMDRFLWKCLLPIEHPFWNKQYVWGADKNGQFIGGANSAMLGNGDFREERYYSARSCGFWHYKIKSVSNTPFNGIDLPCPLDTNREWASTSLIEVAHKVGVQLEIDGGIVWDEKGKYLERWAKEIWIHRKAFQDRDIYPIEVAAKNAEGSGKAFGNNLMGRLVNEYSREYFHPDWNKAIIHQAVTNQTYTLERLYRVFGMTPILLNKDSVYFLTNTPDIDIAANGLFDRQSELSGYKPLGITPFTDEMKAMFAERRSDLNAIEQTIRAGMKQNVTMPIDTIIEER